MTMTEPLADVDAPDAKPGRRYVVISPCRDEAKFARRTLDSVAAQSEPPTLWIVVDDGSTDETPQILAQYEAKLPYLKVVRRENRGFRKLGGGVIDAFNFGYDQIDAADFDYVSKLDLDLDLPPEYFAKVMDELEADDRLACFSGKPYFEANGRLVSERCGDENCVGMVKFFKTEALEDVGGFVPEVMWDGIDGHQLRRRGWRAASRDDEATRFIHLRPMGSSHKSMWTGRVRHGRGQWFMGTSPLYMLASGLFRMTRPPRIVGGFAMLRGYFGAALAREPRYEQKYDEPGFGTFLRRYQRLCLTRGKTAATRRVEQEQAGRLRSERPRDPHTPPPERPTPARTPAAAVTTVTSDTPPPQQAEAA
jgi:glycosyltransferase involved in cell wall biosynthesis